VIDAETIERLKLMRLSGMAQVLIEMGDPNVSGNCSGCGWEPGVAVGGGA